MPFTDFLVHLLKESNVPLFQINADEDLPYHPPKQGDLYILPREIRPVQRRTGIEVKLLMECKWVLAGIVWPPVLIIIWPFDLGMLLGRMLADLVCILFKSVI